MTAPSFVLTMRSRHRPMLLILAIAVAFALLLPATALSAQAQAGEGTNGYDRSQPVTFTRDIAPILQQNCQVCHQAGSIGPMSLVSYEEVRPWAALIRQQVVDRNMPPYHYDTGVGIQQLKDDRRLSTQEIARIVAWADAGAPLGDPADMPPPVVWPDASEWRMAADLGQPDVVVASAPYTVAASGGDVWWRPLVETGITEDRCIRAIEIRPSVKGRRVTHHAIPTFQVANEAGGGETRGQTLSEFAPGKLGELIPGDACRMAPAGAKISWEIHYSPQGVEVQDDQVEVGLWLYPKGHEPKYLQTLRNYSLERQGDGPVLDIAPNSIAMTQGFFSWDHPVRIDSFMPHGHYRMRAKWLEIYTPATGERKMVSMVSNFHVGWQNTYTYADDVAPLVPTGAVVILTAIHDNTAANPLNPDPNQWVMRGSRSVDEMSHAWLAVTHLDEARYQELSAERTIDRPTD